MKQSSKALKIELASYHELQAFAQFGSDLDEATKRTLVHGDVLMEVLKQNQYSPMDFVRQTVEIFTAQHRFLDHLDRANIRPFLDNLYVALNNQHKELLDEIRETKTLSDELIKNLKNAIKELSESLA